MFAQEMSSNVRIRTDRAGMMKVSIARSTEPINANPGVNSGP
jgi:hypothetical protein